MEYVVTHGNILLRNITKTYVGKHQYRRSEERNDKRRRERRSREVM